MGEFENRPARSRRHILAAGAVALGAGVLGSQPAEADIVYIPETEKGVDGGVAAISANGHVLDASNKVLATLDELDSAVVVVSADRFNVDPTGVTISPGFQDAMNMVPDGGTLLIPPGIYLYTTNVFTTTNMTVKIVGYGATFVKSPSAGNTVWGVFKFDMGSPINITVPSNITYSFTAAGSTVPAIQFSLADLSQNLPSNFVEGARVKIVGDDQIPDSRNPGGLPPIARVGQIVEILAKDSTAKSVTVTGPLRDSILTNPRVALMPEGTVAIEGITFDIDPILMGTAGVTSGIVSVSSATQPVVKNCMVKGGNGEAFAFTNCLGFLVADCTISHLADDTSSSTQRLGYGVLSKQSVNGLVSNCNFFDVRHCFTDDVTPIAANSSVQSYGRPVNTKVFGCHAEGTSAPAYSSHHGSDGLQIIDCDATGCPAGVALRGRNHVVRGGVYRSCGSVVQLLSESDGQSWGLQVSDLVAYDCDEVFTISPNQGGTTIELRGNSISRVRAYNLFNRIGGVLRGVLDLSDCRFTVGPSFAYRNHDGSAYAKSSMIGLQNSNVSGRNNTFDSSTSYIGQTSPAGVSVPKIRLIEIGSSTVSQASMSGWDLVNSTSNQHFDSFVSGVAGATLSSVTSIVQLSLRIASLYGNGANKYIPTSFTSHCWIEIESVDGGASNTTMPFSGVDISSADTAALIAQSRTNKLLLLLDPSGATRQLVTLRTPSKSEQTLIVCNISSSLSGGFPITIGTSNSVFLFPGSSTSYSIGAGHTTVWEFAGTQFRLVSDTLSG